MPPIQHYWRRFLPILLLVSAMLATTFVNTAAAQDSVVVRVTTALDPSLVTIEAGTSVTWTNAGNDEHEIRSETGPVRFETDRLEPGDSSTITFTVAGTYTYSDHRNPDNHEYQGTVVVTEPASPGGGDGGTPPTVESPAPSAPPAATEATVRMAGKVFRPGSVTVSVGATVTFLNDDDRAHTATANDFRWDSGIFDTGQNYQKTFSTAGTYSYFCVIHPDMTGTILVSDGGDVPAPAAPSPAPATPPPAPSTTAAPAGPTSQDVEIVDFDFSPLQISIAEGGSVSWRNIGAAPHTVTADSGAFDSGFMFTNDTYTTSFPTAGSYSYYCTLHPLMRATVTVGSGGSGAGPAAPTTPAAPATPSAPMRGISVVMLDNSFAPASTTVTAGSTVRWANNGSVLHTVTAGDGSFDSGFVEPGETYARQFPTPGTFGYVCVIHPGMNGTVLVTDSAGSAPPEEAIPADTIAPDATDAGTAADGASADSFRIDVVDLDYEPRDLTIPVGTEVLWVNTGLAPHTVTAEDGGIDSGIFMPGESFSHLFDEEGVFDYYCTLHPGMEGSVTITQGAEVSFSDSAVAEGPAAPVISAHADPVIALGSAQAAGSTNGLAIAVGVGALLTAMGLGYLALMDWMKLPLRRR